MANGVADTNLPGKVLDPNAPLDSQEPDVLGQFGTELEKPEPDAGKEEGNEADDKRYQYHQSRADKAEAEVARVKAELDKRATYDPLIDVLRKDEEAYRYLQSRLTQTPSSQAKAPEPPQRPDSYNEVEAYSMPDSASFKYRVEREKFRDSELQYVKRQNEELARAREVEKAQADQIGAQREQLRKFRDEVVSKGIANEEFAEFFQTVNQATTEDMVDYFKWKKGQSAPPDPMKGMFPGAGIPPSRSAVDPRTRKNSMLSGSDIGGEVLGASRRM